MIDSKNGVIGLAIGDAMGVPLEFCIREKLQKNITTEMLGYGSHNVPKGTWSDDTSMMIATIDSINSKNGIDYEDIMDEFCSWIYNDEHNNSEEGTFDYGITTGRAIDRYHFENKDPIKCGGTSERDNGNGSLMRILPLAYIKDIDYETIENISSLTHAHMRSKIACVLYTEIAKSLLENDLEKREHVDLACDKIKEYYKNSDELEHFERIFSNDLDEVTGRIYVVGSLECVIHCFLTTDNYRDAVLKAVNMGGDTDTNAAICGGLAGIYYGYDSIPVDWIKQINRIDEVLALCEKYEAFCDES